MSAQYLFSVGCCQQMVYFEWEEILLRNKEKLGLNKKLNMFLGLQLMIKELQTSDLQLNILPAANTRCFKETLILRRLFSNHTIYLSSVLLVPFLIIIICLNS